MRLMHLIHTPRYSGAETLVAALAKLHTADGHVSTVVAMAPAENDFLAVIQEQERIGIKWLYPESPLKKIGRLEYFREKSKEFRPDVIFAHSVLPAAYGRLAGLAPVISVLHDASENDYANKTLRLSEFILQYRSAGVIAVSPRAAKKYQSTFKRPIVQCIPNGIDIDAFKLKDRFVRQRIIRELNIPEDAIVVLQVGRVTVIKQQHLSILALGNLIYSNPKIHLLLVGILEDEESVQRVRQAIVTTNSEKNVHLLGPRKDVSDLLAAADVYLMPSLQEAHSVAMIEALVSGVQIVASKIPPFEYVAAYAGVELIIPTDKNSFSDAISKAIGSINRYERNLSDYDIRTTAKKYIEFSKENIL